MKKVADILFWLFIVLFIGTAVLFSVSDQTDKSIFGHRIYNVATNSMKTDMSLSNRLKGESFERGDLIIVKITAPEEIQLRDVITFVPSGVENASIYLTHRVKEKHEGEEMTFTTRGDVNNKDDPPISGKQVIGKVQCALPILGKVLQQVKDHPLLIVSGGMLVLLISQFIGKHNKKKAS